MNLASFKLESFSRSAEPVEIAEVTFCRDDLDQAYTDGYAEGKAHAYDAQMQELDICLSGLAATLTDDDARRSALRAEAVATLAPILSQILDLMAPAAHSRRLEQALNTELQRLAQSAVPLKARLACGPGLRSMVEHCVRKHGLGNLEIAQIAAAKVSITVEGGRIDLTPEKIAQDVAALIADIKEEAGEWTL